MRTGYLRQKPPLGAAVNWNHPIAQGLLAAFVINEGGGAARDLLTGRIVPFTGAGVRAITRIGQALDFTPTSDFGAAVLAWDRLKFDSAYRGPVSLAYRGTINASPSGFAQLAGVTYNAAFDSPFQQYSLELNSDGSQYALSWGANSVLQTFSGSPITAFDGTERLIVGSIDGVANRMWEMKHGAAMKTITPGGAQGIGPYNNTSTSSMRMAVQAKTLTQFIYIYQRRLIEADVQRLWIDPYGFLQPVQRFAGTAGAAAGGAKFRRTRSEIGTRIGSRQGA